MFRAHKAAADAAGERFRAHRARAAPRLGRVHVREPWLDPKLPATTSIFGGLANTRSVSLLGPAAQKRLLKDRLRVERVTPNGLEIFSALLDKEVEEAIAAAKVIHDEAVARGASKKVFGTDKHVLVASEHPYIREAPRIPDTVARLRVNISNAARERMAAMPPGKRLRKRNYQYIPSYVKTLYNRLSKIAKKSGGKIKVSESVRQAVERIGRLNATAANMLRESLGELTLNGITRDFDERLPFFSEDGMFTFFPGGEALIGASHAKWMSYETALTIMTIGSNARTVHDFFRQILGRDPDHQDLAGFYKQYKLISKDVSGAMGHGEVSMANLIKLQKACLKASIIGYAVPGGTPAEKIVHLARVNHVLLENNYFDAVNNGQGLINKGDPRVLHDRIREMVQALSAKMVQYEDWFHVGAGREF